jgi:hypothetical protein
MAERAPNVTKTVAWFLEKKALIKFVDDEKSYKLAENVVKANNFEKFPIRKADIVEVGILNDTITFLRKAKSQTPKDEGKGSEEAYEPTAEEQKPKTVDPNPVASVPSTNPQIVGEVKELTVYAIASNKKVVKFLEIKDDGWFTIDPSIQAKDYAVIGLQAKNKAKVQIVEKNVVSFEKVAGEAPVKATESTPEARSETKNAETTTSTPKKEFKPEPQEEMTSKDAFYRVKQLENKVRYLQDEKTDSFEAQASVSAAAEVVGRIAASISPAPTANVINSMLSAIAKENYKLIQELKGK